MENNEEYHDPDYPETAVRVKEEPPSLTEEEKEEKIRKIIEAEFKNEIDVRENEVMLADQRMAIARRMLQRLRYTLVSRYYRDRRLQQPEGSAEEPVQASAALRSGQRRLHPSVRKLLGRSTADMDEIFRPLATRNKRRDYSAMVQTRNFTIAADGSSTLRPAAEGGGAAAGGGAAGAAGGGAARAPRRLLPRPERVLTLDDLTRNKVKHRYRIIIGNTSKYAPAASALDRSTHKWLLYVRGAHPAAAAAVLRGATVTLHHSYAPHHTLHIDKPPYHISRRGWGEFPAKVELHFRLPERNRPATVEHTIKLDRDYTGLQTLGAETLVDVWLYSTPDMLEFEYKEEDEHIPIYPEETPDPPETITPKEEPIEQEETTNEPEPVDNWLDFFTTNTKELDVDEMIIKPKKEPVKPDNVDQHIEEVDVKPDLTELENNVKMLDVKLEVKMDWNLEKSIINPSETIPTEILSQPASPKKRIMKYLEPKTGKIYYLEMDRKLDLSKVQEIVINSKGNLKTAKLSPVKPVNGKKKGVSLLKPEVKNMLNNKENKVKNYMHIVNDHCYLGNSWVKNVSFSAREVKSEVRKEDSLYKCLCEAVARFTCVRVAVNYMLKKIPVVSEQARVAEFKRCFPFVETDERFWKMDFAKRRNKEWSRAKLINTILHEHFKAQDPIWRTKQILIFSRLHGYQPVRRDALPAEHSWAAETSAEEFSTISAFRPEDYSDSITECVEDSDDEEIEIVKDEVPAKKEVKKEEPALAAIPAEEAEDRLRFLYIESKCAEIGVQLRNEDVGHGYSYSAVHAVMLSALKSFAEELVRGAVAADLLASRTDLPHGVWTGWAAPGRVAARALAAAAARSRLAALARRDAGQPCQRADEPI